MTDEGRNDALAVEASTVEPTASGGPLTPVVDPVSVEETEQDDQLRDGIALCLSGGGSRAMLFHLGALRRLNEVGLLGKIERISSVSGGSIVAGVLGRRWKELAFDASGRTARLDELVVDPIRAYGRVNVDVPAGVLGVLLPGNPADRLAGSLREHLYGDMTLQDLPSDSEGPRFVFNATNLQSTVLWRFSRPYAGDYRVGRIKDPLIPLAVAVAASSSFPPIFSPLHLKTDGFTWTDDPPLKDGEERIDNDAFREEVLLGDGGIYDNLGLETAYKRYRTLLVSDGGGKTSFDPKPHTDWVRQSIRVMQVIDNQVRSLRKRVLIGAFQGAVRTGTYWGIRSDVDDYGLEKHGRRPPLPAPHDKTMGLAEIATRLAPIDDATQQRLINWGYAITDTALRRWVVDENDPGVPAETFPYAGGVG